MRKSTRIASGRILWWLKVFQLEGGLWWSKVRERERERDIYKIICWCFVDEQCLHTCIKVLFINKFGLQIVEFDANWF